MIFKRDLFAQMDPKPVGAVDVLRQGGEALARANTGLGLALSDGEIDYLLAQYRAILPVVRPELVLIAEVEDQLVGFIFAVPDVKQADRGQPIDTVIVNNVAVVPDRARAGLGSLLLAVCHQTARELGYRRAIHALMHEQNVSRSLSRRYAHPMRRYALFGKALEA